MRLNSGHALGKGNYFATQASTSNGYTKPDAQGHRGIFMARVLVGDYIQSPSNSITLPPMNPQTGKRFWSVGNASTNANVFVTFNNYQSYPMWLVTYK